MSFTQYGRISLETFEKFLMVRWDPVPVCDSYYFVGLTSSNFPYKNKFWRLQLNTFSGGGGGNDLRLFIVDASNQENLAAFRDGNGALMFEAKLQISNDVYYSEEIDQCVVFLNISCNKITNGRILVKFFKDEKGSKKESSLLTGDKFIRLYGNLKEAYLKKLYCDFTIVIQEREFQVHKMILAARSTAFSAMMESNMEESRNNRLTITDCNPEAFQVFLLYLYSESTEEVSTENVTDVYVVSDKYGVLDLKVHCIEYMKSNISVDKFCDVLELAAKYDESELLKALKEYFIEKPREIVTTGDFQSLMKENTGLATEFILLLMPGKLNM